MADDEGTHFIRARIFVGIGIFVLIGVLAVFDALKDDYALDTITLGLLLGTGSVVLGVEPLRNLIK